MMNSGGHHVYVNVIVDLLIPIVIFLAIGNIIGTVFVTHFVSSFHTATFRLCQQADCLLQVNDLCFWLNICFHIHSELYKTLNFKLSSHLTSTFLPFTM